MLGACLQAYGSFSLPSFQAQELPKTANTTCITPAEHQLSMTKSLISRLLVKYMHVTLLVRMGGIQALVPTPKFSGFPVLSDCMKKRTVESLRTALCNLR